MRQSMKSLSLVMLLLLSVCSSMFIVTDVAEANTVVITEAVQVVDGGAASDQQSAVGSDSEGNVLPSAEGDSDFSASRTVDYARDRLDACVFYEYPDDTVLEPYRPGTYLVEILEGSTVIGTTDLVLR